MRDERIYLCDVVQAARDIEYLIASLDCDVVVSCDDVRSAALYKLAVIGEAAGHVSTELRGRHSEVDWTTITAFPNAYVGRYYDIDWHDTWKTVSARIPALREQVGRILAEEFPGLEG